MSARWVVGGLVVAAGLAAGVAEWGRREQTAREAAEQKLGIVRSEARAQAQALEKARAEIGAAASKLAAAGEDFDAARRSWGLERGRLTIQTDLLTVENGELGDRVKALEEQLRATHLASQNLDASLNAEQDRRRMLEATLAAERDAAEETAGALRAREADALKNAEAKARELARSKSETQKAKERLDQAANAANALQQQNNALVQDVNDANADLSAAHANLQAANADWNRALAQMDALDRLNRRLQAELRSAHNEIARLRVELAKLVRNPQQPPQSQPPSRLPHGGPGSQRPGYDLEPDSLMDGTGRAVVDCGK